MDGRYYECGAAAEELARVGVEVEAVVDEHLEDGDGLRSAGCMVEVAARTVGWQVEALAEAPAQDLRVVGGDGGEGDRVEDGRAWGRVGKWDLMSGRSPF